MGAHRSEGGRDWLVPDGPEHTEQSPPWNLMIKHRQIHRRGRRSHMAVRSVLVYWSTGLDQVLLVYWSTGLDQVLLVYWSTPSPTGLDQVLLVYWSRPSPTGLLVHTKSYRSTGLLVHTKSYRSTGLLVHTKSYWSTGLDQVQLV
ncbi:hypothetical protein EYF80_059193 [Liparis tanakae]|uniref:Uncharacterized protein n=1 Tax=Liparis tanakae TaxID=230148 RepID=A0A4Z2EQU4_9TELE|nr:hypothetical protein EYF80_059193 [Liparis tanakae]